jgi:hypothetical protein
VAAGIADGDAGVAIGGAEIGTPRGGGGPARAPSVDRADRAAVAAADVAVLGDE